MSIIAELEKSSQNLSEFFEYHKKEKIKFIKNEEKRKVSDHEWWKIEDIDNANYEEYFTEGEKYIHLTDYFYELIKNRKIKELTYLMDIVEQYLKDCTDEEKNTIEVLLFESLINLTESDKTYSFFYSILGTISRHLCDENHKFWRKVEQIEISKNIQSNYSQSH